MSNRARRLFAFCWVHLFLHGRSTERFLGSLDSVLGMHSRAVRSKCFMRRWFQSIWLAVPSASEPEDHCLPTSSSYCPPILPGPRLWFSIPVCPLLQVQRTISGKKHSGIWVGKTVPVERMRRGRRSQSSRQRFPIGAAHPAQSRLINLMTRNGTRAGERVVS